MNPRSTLIGLDSHARLSSLALVRDDPLLGASHLSTQPGVQMQLTDRQREIKARLDTGMGAREIAEDLGITRNAVYQSIQRMRRDGVLPADYTPTGLPAREAPGRDVLARLLTDGNGPDDENTSAAGAAALVQELRRVRDELDAIARRLSMIVPR